MVPCDPEMDLTTDGKNETLLSLDLSCRQQTSTQTDEYRFDQNTHEFEQNFQQKNIEEKKVLVFTTIKGEKKAQWSSRY
jgi:hypothetical protein